MEQTDQNSDSFGSEFIMKRVCTITRQQARGYVQLFSSFMVRMDHATIDNDELASVATLYSWLRGQWTLAISVSRNNQDIIPMGISRIGKGTGAGLVSLAIAVALRQRYEWAVSLGLENSPSIRFATDPTGIKDIFRIRDLPEGKDRRAALMTWISDHWRQDRRDPEIELYVRNHLRGATAFSWRGMDCTLLPSQFDVDQRDKLIAERAAMKAAGTDKRQKEQKRK
jgi:hypothetical protein